MDQLEVVERAYSRWREGKQRQADPIPEELWKKAVEVARVHGTTLTARRLGLNHSALKQRIDRSTQAFVELPVGLLGGPEAVVEVEDQAGTRMRVVLRGVSAQEVGSLAREIWTARA